MNSETQIVQFIALAGFLILAVSAFSSFRMSWGKTAQMVLTWSAIFLVVFIVITLVMGDRV